jgi:hypothetical protein
MAMPSHKSSFKDEMLALADSNVLQNCNTEGPDARNGRVRICGGALGAISGRYPATSGVALKG